MLNPMQRLMTSRLLDESHQECLFTFGGNLWSQLGVGENNNYYDLPTPVVWSQNVPPEEVVSGLGFNVLLAHDKTLWSWGLNHRGQLGQEGIKSHSVPTRIKWPHQLPPAKMVAGLEYTVILASDGTLWSWGNNSVGQLGLDEIDYADRPTQIPWKYVTPPLKILACPAHVVLMLPGGILWSWGLNNHGQLGVGDDQNHTTPTEVYWPHRARPMQVEGSLTYTLALAADGTLWSWGCNHFGQLGTGDNIRCGIPKQISWDHRSPPHTIIAGSNQVLVLATDGTAWSWGLNNFGQLGVGDNEERNCPAKVVWDYSSSISGATTGYAHTIALASDGTLWSWGDNRYGQLGVGDYLHRNKPTQVIWSYEAPPVKVVSGNVHNLALASDGTIWVWGRNNHGQLGIGGRSNRHTPTQITTLPGGFVARIIRAGSAFSLISK